MTLLITIPKEFEYHYNADRFEDSLHRLAADAHRLAGLYEQETAEMLIESFKTSIRIPPHGDLIDIDRALNGLPEHYDKHDLEDVVGTAPTIIPAEEVL